VSLVQEEVAALGLGVTVDHGAVDLVFAFDLQFGRRELEKEGDEEGTREGVHWSRCFPELGRC